MTEVEELFQVVLRNGEINVSLGVTLNLAISETQRIHLQNQITLKEVQLINLMAAVDVTASTSSTITSSSTTTSTTTICIGRTLGRKIMH